MKEKKISIKELIEYGLDNIDQGQKIEIKARDLVYIYKTIEELRRFFHQPGHYQNLEDIHRYIGVKGEDIIGILNYIYIKIFDGVFDQEIERMLNDEILYSTQKPYYIARK